MAIKKKQHSFAITNSHLALSVGHFMTPRELRHKDLTHCDDSPKKTGLRLLVVSQLGWGILQGLAILPKKKMCGWCLHLYVQPCATECALSVAGNILVQLWENKQDCLAIWNTLITCMTRSWIWTTRKCSQFENQKDNIFTRKTT